MKIVVIGRLELQETSDYRGQNALWTFNTFYKRYSNSEFIALPLMQTRCFRYLSRLNTIVTHH